MFVVTFGYAVDQIAHCQTQCVISGSVHAQSSDGVRLRLSCAYQFKVE